MGDDEIAECDTYLKNEGLSGCVGCSEEQYFHWTNDANNLGGDILEFYFHKH